MVFCNSDTLICYGLNEIPMQVKSRAGWRGVTKEEEDTALAFRKRVAK